jgi:hypothetical protein
MLRVLYALQKLTHLAFNFISAISFCQQILNAHRSLTTMIILNPPSMYRSFELGRLTDDPRFVMMSLGNWAEDWQHGVLAREDYWTRTDAFIAIRISSEINRESPMNYSQPS